MKILIFGLWALILLAVFWLLTDVMDEAWMAYFKSQPKETQELLIDKIEASGVDATVLKLIIENEK